MPEEKKNIAFSIWQKYKIEFETLPGSINKHQAWPGGYKDHIQEVMNIAELLFDSLSKLRELPFLLDSALFILFIHDYDKLVRYQKTENGFERKDDYSDMTEEIQNFLKKEFNYSLSQEELNALKYIHGEGKNYSANERVMQPLAAFVHCCDTISARIWHDYGKSR
ncbi:MAG: hypothetical protein UW14_C0013G0025 [Candidatus Yanofskybacteria bacterium GW2011_GWA2_44_10]|nr:MAG: hypothetical protein UW14_C0013G0025 [Candidatus Yanofskybacteria bacterium GW2011_GWA2_44_10]KKT90395.1 MAG: hypothetical protein UW90_C0002G0044 [Candidatus Yanofskybacteria bacterium GW2011_GWB1_45_11]